MALSPDESRAASWTAGFEASLAASMLEPPVPPLPPLAVAPPKPDTPPDAAAPPESEEPPSPSGPKSCGPSGLAWGASATSDPMASNPEPPSALVWPAKPPGPPIVPPVPPVGALLLEHAARAIATTPRRKQDEFMTLSSDASRVRKGSLALHSGFDVTPWTYLHDSQIAEGIARSLAPAGTRVWSAGSRPTSVRPEAIAVLREIGIDISGHRAKAVGEVPAADVDTVITLCGEEECPVFLGKATRLHWGLPDPAAVNGSEAERLDAFRNVRDELHRRIRDFFAQPGQLLVEHRLAWRWPGAAAGEQEQRNERRR